MEEITLVTCSDERFLSGVAGVFASALAHLSPEYKLRAVLVACAVPPDRRKAFSQALVPLEGERFKLEILELNADRLEGAPVDRPTLTVAQYGRLFIPELLADTPKAIYLDCDMVVTRDLAELWRVPFEGSALMAVEEPETVMQPAIRERFNIPAEGRQFISATLVLDFDQIRASDAIQTCLNYIFSEEYPEIHNDQLALNVVFGPTVKFLPEYWNRQVCLEPEQPNAVPYDACLIHTIFKGKPWFYARQNARGIVALFYHYLDQTNWERYRQDEVRFHHTCPTWRYWYIVFRLWLARLKARGSN